MKRWVLFIGWMCCGLFGLRTATEDRRYTSGGGAKGLVTYWHSKAIDWQGLTLASDGHQHGAIIGALYASGYSADSIERSHALRTGTFAEQLRLAAVAKHE